MDEMLRQMERHWMRFPAQARLRQWPSLGWGSDMAAINLSSTSHVLRLVTDGTEAIDVVASYADWVSGTPFTPDSQETLITTATTTTVVSAPAASTIRMINWVSATNTSATASGITVEVYDGSNAHELGTFTLNADDSLVFSNGKWEVVTAAVNVRCFLAQATADQNNIANSTWRKAEFNDEVYDPFGEYDAATNYRYTPQKAGVYLVLVSVQWADIDDGNRAYAGIYKNGAAVKYAFLTSSATGAAVNPRVQALIQMNGTTDYLEAYAYHENGDATPDLAINGDATCFFGATWVAE
jgi:hypothetical protein